jgi:DNA-directed RNA polymerase specialized sigma24 family protein
MSRKSVRLAPGPSLRAVGEAGGATGEDLDLCMAALAATGDKAAFGRLVQHFAPRLIGFFTHRGAGRAEAEAMTMETLEALWRDAALYDSRRAAPAAFVFVLARNFCLERAAGSALAFAQATGNEKAAAGPALSLATARLRAALEGAK